MLLEVGEGAVGRRKRGRRAEEDAIDAGIGLLGSVWERMGGLERTQRRRRSRVCCYPSVGQSGRYGIAIEGCWPVAEEH